MWTPMDIPIELSRNGITPIGLQIWDAVADEPYDLTSESFTCKVAIALGVSPLAQFEVEVTNAENGEVDIVFDGGAIPIGGGQEINRLAYEVKSADGQTYLRGPLILIPGI